MATANIRDFEKVLTDVKSEADFLEQMALDGGYYNELAYNRCLTCIDVLEGIIERRRLTYQNKLKLAQMVEKWGHMGK